MKSLIYMPSILKLIFNKLIQFKRFFFSYLLNFTIEGTPNSLMYPT